MTDVTEILKYWNKKYPNIFISIYPHQEGQKFFGKMMTANESIDLSADTIGELISQGEGFLRKLNQC